MPSPAVVTSPLAFDPESEDLDGIGIGYVGLKLTHDQRVRAAIDRIVRHKNKILKLEGKIADDEDLLEQLGEDVDELYIELGLEDAPEVPENYSPLGSGGDGPRGGGRR